MLGRIGSLSSAMGRKAGSIARMSRNVARSKSGQFAIGAGAVGAFSLHKRDVNRRGGYNPPSGSAGLRPKSSGGATL